MDMVSILTELKKGTISVKEAEKRIRLHSYNRLGETAKIDIHRQARTGVPEVILGEGKTLDDLMEICTGILESGERAMVTRVTEEQYDAISDLANTQWFGQAKIMVLNSHISIVKTGGKVGIISAGTSDIPVSEEARLIAEELGCEVFTVYDVGVAGIHRLFPELSRMTKEDVDVVIVSAGREGTLPSVVSGLIDCPVIGLPTSTGYGFGGLGEAALLSMLQSCSVISVVNIDAGFVAGAYAAKVANRAARERK